MRVLFVNQTAQMSGAEHSLLSLIDGMRDEVEIACACPAGDLADALESRGVPVHRIVATDASFRIHPLHTPIAIAEIAIGSIGVVRARRRVRPDIVHANTTRAGLIACVAGLAGGPPVIVHARDWVPEGRLSRNTLRWARRRAAAVIANSRFVAQQFPESGDRPPVDVVVNPIDPARFDPGRVPRADARRKLGLGDHELVLGVVGQLTPWKGQDDAIRVLAHLRRTASIANARLLVVGSAKFSASSTRFDNVEYADRLTRLPAELGVERAVTFLGERSDVPEILRALDLLLMPSWREAFGRVAVEAMAMGTPVVTTNVGGPSEIVRAGVDGLLLTPHDPEAWASAIAGLLGRPGALGEMGRNAQDRATDYDVSRSVAGVFEVYGRVLE